MRIFGLAARGAAVGILVAGCGTSQTSGGSSSGSTGGGTTASSTGSASSGAGGGAARAIIDMFCNGISVPTCEAYFACCTGPNFQFPTLDWCKNDIEASFTFCSPFGADSVLETSLEAGTTVFDQAQFESCLALLKSMSAGGTACVQPPREVVETACFSAFRGQIAPGEACPWPPAWLWTNAVMFCKDGSCDNGVCVPFLKPGDACPVSPPPPTASQCNWYKGEWCHGDPQGGGAGGGDGGTTAMGICAPAGDLGDACHTGNRWECKSHNCDQLTGKCVLPDPSWSACDH